MKRDHRKRDMYRNIPWDVRTDIVQRLENMPESNDKLICLLALRDGLSTTDIAYYCIDHDVLSRNSNPYSRRRIQQIIAENIPEYADYQVHRERAKKRADHLKFIADNKAERCAFCGEIENLEWHHMIPVMLGGDTDSRNMIPLCSKCHSVVTEYQREKFAAIWYHREKAND